MMTVDDVGLRFCDVTFPWTVAEWLTITSTRVPRDGSKRVKAGDKRQVREIRERRTERHCLRGERHGCRSGIHGT